MAYKVRSAYGYVHVDEETSDVYLPSTALVGLGTVSASTPDVTQNIVDIGSIAIAGEGAVTQTLSVIQNVVNLGTLALTGAGTVTAPTPTVTFTPTALAGLRLWLAKGATRYQDDARTTLVTTSGQPVSSWTDASGGSRHTLKHVDGTRPLEVAARDGVDFATSALQTPSLAAYAGDFLIGLVVTPDTLAPGYARLLERGASGSGVFLGTNATNTLLAIIGSTASSAVACVAGSRHAVVLERVGTTAKLYVDSTTPGATWTVTGAAIADAATWLGADDGGASAYYDGKLHEVVIAKDHSAGDVTLLMNYLLTV